VKVLKEKTKEIAPLFCSQAPRTSSKNPLTATHSWHHPKKSSKLKVPRFFIREPSRLST